MGYPHRTIAEQAAYWLIRSTDDELSLPERHELLGWLRQSPEHVTELLRMLLLDATLVAWKPKSEAIPRQMPNLLTAAVIDRVCSTGDGLLIRAASDQLLDVISMLERNPHFMHQIPWRRWEEIVAGVWQLYGYEVELTPASRDGGRDIIATHRHVSAIRIFDQVKAFRPDRVVTAHDVQAMLGVLEVYANVSKACVTTTAKFATGIERDPLLKRFMPFRLELRPGSTLLSWMSQAKDHRP